MLIDEVKNNQWVEDPAIEVIKAMLDETATNVSAYKSVSGYVKEVLKILNNVNGILGRLHSPLRLFLANEEYDEPKDGYGEFAIYAQKQLFSEDGKVYYGLAENDYYTNYLRIDEVFSNVQSTLGCVLTDLFDKKYNIQSTLGCVLTDLLDKK